MFAHAPGYDITTASLGGRPVATSSGLRLIPGKDLRDITTAPDLLLVPGGEGARRRDPDLVGWLREHPPKASRRPPVPAATAPPRRCAARSAAPPASAPPNTAADSVRRSPGPLQDWLKAADPHPLYNAGAEAGAPPEVVAALRAKSRFVHA